MAVIVGSLSNIPADVDSSNNLALFVVQRPRDAAGAFTAAGATGVIPAAAAANSIWFGMRNGPFNNLKRVYVTRLYCMLHVHATPTAAANSLSFDALRYSGGNLQTITSLNAFQKKPYNRLVVSACTNSGIEGGQIQMATTAGLTSANATLDTSPYPILPVLTAIGSGATNGIPAAGTRIERTIENDAGFEHMMELGPGDGFLIRNNVAIPTAMTGVLFVSVCWHER